MLGHHRDFKLSCSLKQLVKVLLRVQNHNFGHGNVLGRERAANRGECSASSNKT